VSKRVPKYRAKVPGVFQTDFDIRADKTTDYWFCYGSNTFVGTYTYRGKTLDIYCCGEMRMTHKGDIWRYSDDINIRPKNDAKLAELIQSGQIQQLDNCWFEVFYKDDEEWGDDTTNIIGESLDEVLSYAHKLLSAG